MAASVAGGIGAELGGGKFANGAVTGAFGYIFNKLLHKSNVEKQAVDALRKSSMAGDVLNQLDQSAKDYLVEFDDKFVGQNGSPGQFDPGTRGTPGSGLDK